MKLVAVGGGSGGHVTPVLAVINELAKHDPTLAVTFVSDKAFEAQARGLMETADVPVAVRTINAGKLRRYHGVSWFKQLLDLPTTASNLRDIGRTTAGFGQSLRLLRRERPDVLFAKGGYVCLPMGMAARLLKIPIVIHDSDTRAGLTNRVLARWATRIATGAPLENYPSYPRTISQYVGVPIKAEFHPFNPEEQRAARHQIGVIDPTQPLVVVTGGGLGAKSINDAMVAIAPQLIEAGVSVYHITGKKHFEQIEANVINHPNYTVVPFVYQDMPAVLGAADVVVARGSATFTQEIAALHKPMIMIPAGHLGDQMKNADVYKKADAAIVLHDTQIGSRPQALLEAILGLKSDHARAAALAQKLATFARADAAERVAEMIAEAYAESISRQGRGAS